MVEQIAVFNVVHAALGIQKFNVLLQFFALSEGLHQLVQHQLLVRVQLCGVCRVYRGERGIPQGVALLPYLHGVGVPVDAAQIIPPLHLEIRVAVDDLTFQFEHEDGDGLVHHSAAVKHPLRIGAAGGVRVGHPNRKIIFAVELLRHALQVPQVDAVAILQHPVVVVGKRGLKYGADADRTSGGSTHPYHVMVAPLDIYIVMTHQQIQNNVRAGTAVKQIAHDMQLIHRQMLDQLAQAHDKAVGAAVLDDAAHDLAVVQVFIVILKVGVEQLVQNIATAGRQTAAHMVAGVLGGHQTADVDQLEKGLGVPLLQCILGGASRLELGQFFGGIIDQGGKLGTGCFRHGIAQHGIHLFPDDTGSRVQDMHKGFVLTVQVTHEMLRTLGQLEQRLIADDLAGSRRLRGVISGQQGQILQIIADLIGFGAHGLLHHNAFLALQRCCVFCIIVSMYFSIARMAPKVVY